MLTTQELLKKIRRVEIKARTLSNNLFAGDYHTSFKGRGMSFSEVREYAYGDDVRFIDWNVSARFGHPYVKVFEEERELTMMLLIDISKSNLFGTQTQLKRDTITEISATLAFSALNNNDKIGAIFFTDKVEKFIPPKKGKSHVLQILHHLIQLEPKQNTHTDINCALQYLQKTTKHKSIAFVLSDFYVPDYQKSLGAVAHKHDITGIHIYDKVDAQLPAIGLVQVQDLETQNTQWLDTNNVTTRKTYNHLFNQKVQQTQSLFAQHNAGFLSFSTEDDYVKKLHYYFKSR